VNRSADFWWASVALLLYSRLQLMVGDKKSPPKTEFNVSSLGSLHHGTGVHQWNVRLSTMVWSPTILVSLSMHL
jgi:hypothetical protein